MKESDMILIALLLECLIGEAIKGNEQALLVLVELPSTLRLLKRVSERAARRYNDDKDDIGQILWLVIRTKMRSLKNPRRLESWLYAAAKHHCLNSKRHVKVVRNHRDTFVRANHQDTPFEDELMLDSGTVQTPEEELLEKEDDSLAEERLKRLREVTSRFPPEVVEKWRDEKSPKKISQETRIPLSTTYRILKRMEQAIFEEFGAQPK